jgi:hypothetical protein
VLSPSGVPYGKSDARLVLVRIQQRGSTDDRRREKGQWWKNTDDRRKEKGSWCDYSDDKKEQKGQQRDYQRRQEER